MTTGSQLHGARWPRFNCVQMIETMSWAFTLFSFSPRHQR